MTNVECPMNEKNDEIFNARNRWRALVRYFSIRAQLVIRHLCFVLLEFFNHSCVSWAKQM